MAILDKYLEELHDDARKDFDKGEDKYGRDDDDKIGRIHDEIKRIRELLEEHLIDKSEAEKDERKAGEDELKKVEKDRDDRKDEK